MRTRDAEWITHRLTQFYDFEGQPCRAGILLGARPAANGRLNQWLDRGNLASDKALR